MVDSLACVVEGKFAPWKLLMLGRGGPRSVLHMPLSYLALSYAAPSVRCIHSLPTKLLQLLLALRRDKLQQIVGKLGWWAEEEAPRVEPRHGHTPRLASPESQDQLPVLEGMGENDEGDGR